MFSLTIAFGPGPTIWKLLFKEKANAQATSGALRNEQDRPFSVTDDFGQEFSAPFKDIHGILLEDLAQSALARQELELHEARTRNAIVQAAHSDPALKNALMQQPNPNVMRGASVLTPRGL